MTKTNTVIVIKPGSKWFVVNRDGSIEVTRTNKHRVFAVGGEGVEHSFRRANFGKAGAFFPVTTPPVRIK